MRFRVERYVIACPCAITQFESLLCASPIVQPLYIACGRYGQTASELVIVPDAIQTGDGVCAVAVKNTQIWGTVFGPVLPPARFVFKIAALTRQSAAPSDLPRFQRVAVPRSSPRPIHRKSSHRQASMIPYVHSHSSRSPRPLPWMASQIAGRS